MGQRLQLNKGISRSRSGDDYATDALIERMTRRCRGLTKAEQRAQQAAACERAAEARRRLWYMLMLDAPLRLADALRERSAEGEDYSNRQGIKELRLALAGWLEKWDAEESRHEAKQGRRYRGAARRRAMPLWSLTRWPAMTEANEKALARAWPFVDRVADRDGLCLLAASEGQGGDIGEARALWLAEIEAVCEWNAKLAIATAAKFFAGDSLTLTMSDLIMESWDGLRRAAMDYDPSTAKFSTHGVNWCGQRVRKAIETGTLIHTPTWIREIMGALRRGSKSWADADKARRKAAAKARRAGENAGAAGEQAMRAALAKAEAGSVLRPLDPAEVLAACEEIAGGVSEERGSELLADVLGMDDRQAAAVAFDVTGGGDDAAEAALWHVGRAHGKKPTAILAALRTAPHRIDSIDSERDDEEARPQVVLVADVGDRSGEAEAAVLDREMRELLDRLAARDEEGRDQAEVIRRFYGLAGIRGDKDSATLTAIASAPLESGRIVHRNQAAKLRDVGLAWMRRQAGVKPPPVRLLCTNATGHREGAGLRMARAARRLRRRPARPLAVAA